MSGECYSQNECKPMDTIEEPTIRFISYEDLVEHLTFFDRSDGKNIYLNSKFIVSMESHFFGHGDGQTAIPIRSNCLRVGIVTSGYLNLVVNMKEYTVKAGDLIFLNWGSIIELLNHEEAAVVRGFVLSEDYVRTNLADQIPQFIKNPRLSFSLTLALEDVEAIDYYLKGFIRLSRLAHNPESNIYKSLFSSLLYFIDSQRGDKHPDAGSEIKAEVRLVDAFLLMVCDNKQRKNNIDYYASQLFVSCNYLCTSVKRETGETVKSWIDRSLINNIKF